MRTRISLLTLVALLGLAAAAWAVVPKPDKEPYEGRTSQNKPVFVKVNDKSRIHAFLIKYKAGCGGGDSYTGVVKDVDKKGDRITQQNGVFSGDKVKDEDAGGGYRGKVHLTYSGKFTTPTKANGTAKVTVTVTYAGDKVATCKKKGITWSVDDQPG
jgi:hypothetical protein